MIVTLALRVLQLLIAAVVLALSVVLVNGYGPGHAPSLLDYGAFCGAGALLFAAVGVLALFIDKLQGVIMLAVDGLATFFLLAGAAAFSAKVKSGNCTNIFYLSDISNTINTSDDKIYSGKSENDRASSKLNDLENRCRMVQADEAFLWILVICYIGTVVLAFFGGRSGKGGAIV